MWSESISVSQLTHTIISGVREDNTTDDYLASLDVSGYNYGYSHYKAAHARVPARVIAGTESFPMQSYATWEAVVDNPWVIGDFIWTAIGIILIASASDAACF